MIEFTDILYGKVVLPQWLGAFLKIPEFVRLRGVRLSNVDSFQFKDLNGPTRWDHSVAVAALADRCARVRGLPKRDSIHLTLAGLLHDVATPPFGHTAEYVFADFDHERESQRLLGGIRRGDVQPDAPVFSSQLAQFWKACRSLSRSLRVSVDPNEVARIVVGDGEHGFLIKGSLDLDNADNVTRACMYLGIEVDKQVPLGIADWLARQSHAPTDLSEQTQPEVTTWLSYRRELYRCFYNASDDELSRQAFLQHLMRRATDAGIPREQILWNTDEGFLRSLEEFTDAATGDGAPSIRELVQRYRLMEALTKLVRIEMHDDEQMSILRSPLAIRWIERDLCSKGLCLIPMVLVRRYDPGESRESLFPASRGAFVVFKLGGQLKREELPEWFVSPLPKHIVGRRLERAFSDAVRRQISVWSSRKPWLAFSLARKSSVVERLKCVGVWSFRLSRNESMHPYPSTFVHAIPANLIRALGVQGELIVDPLGGTGQTAVEAIKQGSDAVSADCNAIACLVARAKLTYLPSRTRERLRSVGPVDITNCAAAEPPGGHLQDKWYHPRTLGELCRISGFITSRRDSVARQFLSACFSAVITSCTGRKGEQHGYFADNAPLQKGQDAPPYRDAIALFLARVGRNLGTIEQLYGFLERDGRSSEAELPRARVVSLDSTRASPQDFQLEPHSVAAIITSPPYLCMSDYALGQRLSYEWLYPELLQKDFDAEIGARRSRFRPEVARETYLEKLRNFGMLAAQLLRPGGFLAMVTGAPVAVAFHSSRIVEAMDEIWSQCGFRLLWKTWRPIHWHRNQGYQRLRQERVAVHVFE